MEGDGSNNLALSNCFICYICRDYFKRPRVLPCGHTFCSECLAKLRDDIVSDGKSDLDQIIPPGDTAHTKLGNGVEKNPLTLSPERSVDNGVVYGANGCTDAVKSKEECSERKSSSSCVDDLDNMFIQPPSSMSSMYSSNGQCTGMSMSSSATYTSINEKVDNKRIQKQTMIPRNTSPGNNKCDSKIANERSPSMMSSTIHTKNKQQCFQCGSIVSSTRNSSTSPIKRSTSMGSTREQSPTCLRDLPRWNTSSPNRKSMSAMQPPACSFDHKHNREMEQFVCPIPQCNYSLRVMNLARWSPKNKVLANALAAWQRQRVDTKECATQTDISANKSVLVTIPRNLVVDSSPSSSSMVPLSRRKRHSSMIDMGSLHQPGYIPRGHYTWKTYAAMVGMNILQQILNL